MDTAAPQNRLRLTEIFLSLQGEANAAGWPTVFVRLTGCPLRCQYCDTAYAFHGGQWWEIDDILAEVARHGVRHVCVTGGEPLAQKRCTALLRRLCDAGYDRSFDYGTGPIGTGRDVPGCDGVHVDRAVGTVRLPDGVQLDLGGIGKGAAVDRAIELLRPLVRGAIVDLGGDLRVWGDPPNDRGWSVAVEDVRTGAEAARLWLAAGAVATSTTQRRRWASVPKA